MSFFSFKLFSISQYGKARGAKIFNINICCFFFFPSVWKHVREEKKINRKNNKISLCYFLTLFGLEINKINKRNKKYFINLLLHPSYF